MLIILEASQCSYVFKDGSTFGYFNYKCTCGCIDSLSYEEAKANICDSCLEWWGWLLVAAGVVILIIGIIFGISKWRGRKARN